MPVGTSAYPAALDTQATLLGTALNNFSTTLAAPLAPGDTSIQLTDASLLSSASVLTLERPGGEIVFYENKSGNTLQNVTRGVDGSVTPGSTYPAGTKVYQFAVARHFNLLRDALIVLETKLGFGADVAGAGEFLVGSGAGATEFRALQAGDIPNLSASYSVVGHTHSVAGDLSGTVGAATVIRLQGRNVANTAPTDQQALRWNDSLSQWEPQTVIGMQIGNSVVSATAGSVLFAGAAGVLQQDNANFFWDDTNNRLGIGTAAPTARLQINAAQTGDDAVVLRDTTGNANARFYFTAPIGSAADLNISAGRVIFPGIVRFGSAGLEFASGINWTLGGSSFQLGGASSYSLRNLVTNTQIFSGGYNASTVLRPHSSSYYVLLSPSGGNVGINQSSPAAQLHVSSPAIGTVAEIIQGFSGQTANLTEWRNSTGTPMAYVGADGFLTIGVGTTAGSATPTLRFRGGSGTGDAVGGIEFYGEGNSRLASIRHQGGNWGSETIIFNFNQTNAYNDYRDVFSFSKTGLFQAGLSNGTVNGQMVFYNTSAGAEVANITVGNMSTGANSNSSIRFDSYNTGVFRVKIVAEAPTGTNVSGNLNFYTNNGTTLTSRLFLKSTGEVGIGNTSPTSLLSVGAASEFQVRSNGSVKPASMTDAAAANDSIYYSTTQSKLCYKDSGGTVNILY